MLAATALSAGASAYGAINQSQALNAQADYSESMARVNQRFAERQAGDALERGEENARTAIRRSDQARGTQRASMAGQGIVLDSGSAMDIQNETAVAGARDAARIRQNTQLEAWGIRTNSAQAVNQSRMQAEGMRNESRSTLITGGLRAVSDLGRGYYQASGNNTKQG